MNAEAPPVEPTVDIVPAPWFGVLAKVAGMACGLLGAYGLVAWSANGQPARGLFTFAAGTLLGVMAYDAGGRWARSHGDVLELRQWFRTIEVQRADVIEFSAVRASLLRWDIVAQRQDGGNLRLWVTRNLVAGRRTRQRWMEELEAWRTWIGAPAPG